MNRRLSSMNMGQREINVKKERTDLKGIPVSYVDVGEMA